MTTRQVLFIQGGGSGAHAADAPLAASLAQALGDGYAVHYPRLPDEGDPRFAPWKAQITAELQKLPRGEVTLVGHSLGGAALLSDLAEQPPPRPVSALVLLAAPAWDGQQWAFDDLRLPDDLADRLAPLPRLWLYHCRDDETVPFAHLALHAQRLPHAVTCALAHGGHQFGHDLHAVAADLRAADAET